MYRSLSAISYTLINQFSASDQINKCLHGREWTPFISFAFSICNLHLVMVFRQKYEQKISKYVVNIQDI